MSTILLLIFSLLYNIFILFNYCFKKHIDLYENKVYLSLVLSNLVGLILEIFCMFSAIGYVNIDSNLIVRLFMIYLFIWGGILTLYISIISKSKNNNNVLITICYAVSYIIFSIPICILPLDFISTGNSYYSAGVCVEYLVSISTAYILIDCFLIAKNFKNIALKKCLPVIIYLVAMTIIIVIQRINPSLSLITAFETFIVVLMYHTIENPDIQMIEQLNIARDQAEKANQAKSEFLSNMSHEIRTPLNAIVGFSQALQEDENLPESAKDEVHDIISASNSLLELVNGILDISKIEANKLEIVNTEYSFKNVFNDLVSLTKGRLGEKPLDFRFTYDESIPGVLYGDHSRIKQIILNLLTNAVKYTKEGYVDFKVSSVIQGDVCRLIVSVEDSGIGIKNENIDKLFTKFERFDLEKNITIEGTGLGLAITKKLVELMNGKIVVQSVYGKGSKFTVAIDQKIMIGKEAVVEDSQTEVEMFDASDKKVLIVDDNKINLKVAARLLDNYKVQVETVESGFDCISKLENGATYDLILMDDMMPRMSGVETFHKLRDMGVEIPCVALTANAISGMKEKYLNEGFNDYLSKPIDKLDLNVVMNKYLKK